MFPLFRLFPTLFKQLRLPNLYKFTMFNCSYRVQVVYMVFNTPSNSIPGSAVCRFSTAAFKAAFEGAFKYQV